MNASDFLQDLGTFLWSNGFDQTGLVVTARLFLLAAIPGLVLASACALLQVYGLRYVAQPIALFGYFFRGTPLYLQLMLIYYGLSQFEVVQNGWADGNPFWLMFRNALFCAVIGFALNTAAYSMQVLKGALLSYPRGEIVAAEARGMSFAKIVFRIVLPGALRRTVPAYSNEMVFLLHATSLASTITLLDITGVARAIYASTYSLFYPFFVAALFYMTCTFLLLYAFRQAERKWLAFLRPAAPSMVAKPSL
ncbi:ABC transporter permease [Paraburkholderia antibiotica]|uniref:ABC transporter permease subunit n=1 Tax=Paraburkholderia antibiotica TaxID=2728839 RepID=A0A7Y0A0W2_9BURK|nr:ABC transporter permease subunit [Paraburkholderia antibiotica]NML34449.1 ABC transporter permease subunit [Paraburkholderia antibiotica]